MLENLEPKTVMKYFEEISGIPRGSKNEKRISDYLLKFAKDRNLQVIQDEALNIIIKKRATKGYEHVPIVIIQGHMDMVCEKNQDTVHDFEKDGIKLKIDGGFIKADGTTLGADNGIAVAFSLAILDSDLPHPNLEIVLTSDEEMGMSGADRLDTSKLCGKIMINIDTEEEGEFYVSCAGGSRGVFAIPFERCAVLGNIAEYRIKVRGLEGGHSGADIYKQKGNSNKLLGRFLKELHKTMAFNIVEINGGAKSNAIPREADTSIIFEAEYLEILRRAVEEYNSVIKGEYRISDPGVVINIERVEYNSYEMMTSESTEKIIDAIFLHANGVRSMSMDIDGLVECSLNLGVMKTGKNTVILESAIRSSVESLRRAVELELETLSEVLKCEFYVDSFYPAWKYKPQSRIREVCAEIYEKFTGNNAEIKAIHAGLECGIFSEKLGEDVDMISFGPNIYGAHTPEERVEISSVKNVWEYFVKLMEEIKNYY